MASFAGLPLVSHLDVGKEGGRLRANLAGRRILVGTPHFLTVRLDVRNPRRPQLSMTSLTKFRSCQRLPEEEVRQASWRGGFDMKPRSLQFEIGSTVFYRCFPTRENPRTQATTRLK